MPIQKRWSKATVENVRERAPAGKGVYELKSFGELVFVGYSRFLRDDLAEVVERQTPNYFRFQTVSFPAEARRVARRHYDRFVETNGSPPRWNPGRP
jgi:hypothetical protein